MRRPAGTLSEQCAWMWRTEARAFAALHANEGVRTVAGELSAALERILSEAPVLTVAGRTDAGVHATGQVVSFRIGGEGLRRLVGGHARQRPAVLTEPDDTADGADQGASGAASLPRLASSLNGALNPDIAVTAAAFAADSFDARRSAVGRAYEYRVRNTALFDPRYADLEWHVAAPLDLGEMNSAAQHFVGEHDFTSFCRRPKGRPDASLVRTVTRARWQAAAAPSGAVQQVSRVSRVSMVRKPLGRSRSVAACRPGLRPNQADGSCASRSRPTRSATRWCVPSWATAWRWVAATGQPMTCPRCWLHAAGMRQPPLHRPMG